MRLSALAISFALISATATAADTALITPPPVQPAGYVPVPGAAVQPDKTQVYKAIFDATKIAEMPDKTVPAIEMLSIEQDALLSSSVPAKNLNLAIVFHGEAIDAVLNDDAYNARHGVPNPNLSAIAAVKKKGAEVLVCGQQMRADGITPAMLSPDVKVASDALIVLVAYQNHGYALMSF
ncbi:MAG TPA: DsrE family protein [Alphaproteobacteria bacterium]|nr:DsrE family protein [Alphaproteobacteria bacterium]